MKLAWPGKSSAIVSATHPLVRRGDRREAVNGAMPMQLNISQKMY